MYQPILDNFCGLKMRRFFIGSSPKIKNAMKNHNINRGKTEKEFYVT